MKKIFTLLFLFLVVGYISTDRIEAQPTTFTYQGSLKDGANPANGNYDIEIDVFDAVTGGNYFNTITSTDVPVVNGTFSLKLDLGVNMFTGGPRFFQIKVRQSGSSTWIPLNPRQEVTSSPHAIRSLNAVNATSADTAANATNAVTAANALQLGGVAANQFVQTGDPRLSNARPPTAGSSDYIQNQAGANQQSANFYITGNGSVAANSNTVFRVGPNVGSLHKLQVATSGNAGLRVQTDSGGGTVASFGGNGDFIVDRPGIVGGRFTLKENGNFGFGTNDTTRGFFTVQAPAGNTNIFMKPGGTTKGINFGIAGTATDSVLYVSQYDGTTYKDRLIIDETGKVTVPVLAVHDIMGKVRFHSSIYVEGLSNGGAPIRGVVAMRSDNGGHCYALYFPENGILSSYEYSCATNLNEAEVDKTSLPGTPVRQYDVLGVQDKMERLQNENKELRENQTALEKRLRNLEQALTKITKGQ